MFRIEPNYWKIFSSSTPGAEPLTPGVPLLSGYRFSVLCFFIPNEEIHSKGEQFKCPG
jgi:hypothetical protein